ncbi:hypothetical protein CcrMagneto_gp185 [Caulobacter virus Magneto]|uniref:hypothetical protein n=1 Tax=Caulobacter virus Magneto TaxID=1211642 RepID=UPI00028A42E1|nr:hypothetical protein CcrMagneto_gp185 [Caulobacter virus Magneto]AFU87355.1 hypothetical protein CcrMagneto_gp185 [Caulobacter virus Magneto]
MLLRLDNGPRTFDFRPAKQGWGHALHASTFQIAPPRKVKRGWFRKPLLIDRASVMVHCQGPRLGDTVIYEAQSGKIRTCVIVGIEPAIGVDDMYTLTLEMAPEDAA